MSNELITGENNERVKGFFLLCCFPNFLNTFSFY
jgi:hypothetical protein